MATIFLMHYTQAEQFEIEIRFRKSYFKAVITEDQFNKLTLWFGEDKTLQAKEMPGGLYFKIEP